MSNYHVLEMRERVDGLKVAFHIAVPNANNFAGINIRTVLTQALTAEERTSIVPWIEASEQTQLTNGELLEHVEQMRFDANLTKVQKRNLINDRYTALASSIATKLQNVYDFWGYDGTVT